MTEREFLWRTTDPRGLSIGLARDVWEDILRKHPEMDAMADQVRLAVEQPEEIFFDPESTKQRITGAKIFLYYRQSSILEK